MRRYVVVIATALAMMLVLPAAGAAAASPLEVEIDVEENLNAPGHFTATGPAVDEGVLCATGTTIDLEGRRSPDAPWGFTVNVLKEFTCDDGSGTFQVRLQGRVFAEGSPQSTFHWSVAGSC